MKRLWIRAHALPNVIDRSRSVAAVDLVTVQHLFIAMDAAADPNDMIVVEIPDELAAAVSKDNYLLACGKVLTDDEEPPYLGSDTPDAEAR